MEGMEDIMSEPSPSPPPPPSSPVFSLPSRSSSWPLSLPSHRMSPHHYNLRHRPGRIPSTVLSDNGSAAPTADSTASTTSTDSLYQFPQEPYGDPIPHSEAMTELLGATSATQQHRPSRLRVLARLLRRGALIAAIFYAGIVVGWNLMRKATEAREIEPAENLQEKQQYLVERLGADLQMLHHVPLNAMGIMSAPASDASVNEVELCKRAVGKNYRKLSAVWHPDSCPYGKQGIIAKWQCAELYKMLGRKKDGALFDCLNTEMAVAEGLRRMQRKYDE